VAIGILGATVMPHNLYLHSALVQTRRIGVSDKEKQIACHFNLVDSSIALNGALLVNGAILVVAASVFFSRGIVVTEIQQAHLLLVPLLGVSAAGIVFAIALLCSGQSSTLTGTMAGQIVMEGFLNIRMRPWLRRMLTRSMAIIPAAITVYFAGDRGTFQLLILSQVILSLQLPFAVIPLIHFTSDPQRMGRFVNRAWVKVLAWITAAIILALNIRLAGIAIAEWLQKAGRARVWVELLLFPALGLILFLLLWVTFEPLIFRQFRRFGTLSIRMPRSVAADLPVPSYHKILVPLDHTKRDRQAIAHAAMFAKSPEAKLFLLHVEEDVTSQIYGSQSSTAEVVAGQQYLTDIASDLAAQGINVEMIVRYSRDPKSEIVRYAKQLHPDLIVMGAHGHKGIKDLIFGTTINAVRHNLKIPLLVVRDQDPISRVSP
jgi:manganese transport protein